MGKPRSDGNKQDSQDLLNTYFQNYLEEPSIESFMRMRDEYMASGDYKPDMMEKARLYSLLKQEKYEEAINYLWPRMQNWLMNPDIG